MVLGNKLLPWKRGDLSQDTLSLIEATYANDLNVATFILRNKPDEINYTEDTTGDTALHVAVGRGNLRMVRLLLSQPGVDIAIRNNLGFDALDLAIRLGHQPKIKEMLFRFRAAQLGLDGKSKPSLA